MDKPDALRMADALEDDLADYRGGSHPRFSQNILNAAAELRRLHAQRDALLEALKTFGWHDEDCPQHPTYTHPERWPACTCGFDAAIAAVEGKP